MRSLVAPSLVVLASLGAAAAPSPESGRDVGLTFLTHRSGFNEICTLPPDGADPRPIFGGPIRDVPSFDDSYTMFRDPHWTRQSPDGRLFASWVYEVGRPEEAFQGMPRPMLVVGDIAGAWTRVVNPDCHEEFAWDPGSRRLAYSILPTARSRGPRPDRQDPTEVWVSGFDGSHATLVLRADGVWVVLDWSPDGKRLLLARRTFAGSLEESRSDLFEFRLQDFLAAEDVAPVGGDRPGGDFLEPIDAGPAGLQPLGARYSPTRPEIAIETYDPGNMFAPNLVAEDDLGRGRMMRLLGKIVVFDREAKSRRTVADDEDGIRGPICWSADGERIYFSRYLPKDDDREKLAVSKEHGLAIWSVGRDGSDPGFVTTGWSPDFSRAASPETR